MTAVKPTAEELLELARKLQPGNFDIPSLSDIADAAEALRSLASHRQPESAPEPLTASMCRSPDYAQGWNDCLNAYAKPLVQKWERESHPKCDLEDVARLACAKELRIEIERMESEPLSKARTANEGRTLWEGWRAYAKLLRGEK